VLQAPSLIVGAFAAFVLLRLVVAARAGTGHRALPATGPRLWRKVAADAWSPHVATTVIAIAFVVMFLLVGAWAYTDVLADLARGMAGSVGARFLLLAALLIGAMAGGWSAGRLRSGGITPSQLLRCLAGGCLMGWGSLLIPGGNDGLILVGMPLLQPYAWIAFATMCVAIAAAHWMERRLGDPARLA
jgi:toxin CptA